MTPLTTTRPTVGLTPEELIRRYQDDGDREARDAAVAGLMPLVASLCRRYEGRAEWDDLMQVATLGLCKAIDRFDADQGFAISSFAVPTILGELRRYFRDRTWAVRPPRSLQERSLLVSRAISKLTSLHGRSPVPAVVAEHLGLSEEDVVEAIVAGRAYSSDSLDAPAGADDDEGTTLGARIGVSDPDLVKAEQRTLLAGLMEVLGERE